MGLKDNLETYLNNKQVSELRVRSITQPDGTVVSYDTIESMQNSLERATRDEADPTTAYGSIKLSGSM